MRVFSFISLSLFILSAAGAIAACSSEPSNDGSGPSNDGGTRADTSAPPKSDGSIDAGIAVDAIAADTSAIVDANAGTELVHFVGRFDTSDASAARM
jgi:hypothetical protein